LIDANGVAVRDSGGKIRYQTVIAFASDSVRTAWSLAVIEALLAVHPHALDRDADANKTAKAAPAPASGPDWDDNGQGAA
jgi:hypothetical protein